MSDGDYSDIAREVGPEEAGKRLKRIAEQKIREAEQENTEKATFEPGNEHDPFGPNENKDAQGDTTAEKPLRPMPSWIAYGRSEIDPTQYHVGEGFLEIGGFVMLIGQSYAGKSTLIAQLSIYLAVGRSWLFFRIWRPLRVMVVQAEDPENKLIKMGHMFKRMDLAEKEIELAHKNTAVLTIRDLQEAEAIAEVERHAAVFKPDIIIINPMTSYLGGSVYKDDVINKFLRVGLVPMLDRLKASAIVVHHPPKPIVTDKEPKDLTAFELQYGGAGMAALTNAPRGNMFLVHVDGDVFKLSVGKGFEDLATKETVAHLKRSKDTAGIMLWERCESDKAAEATEKEVQRKARKTKEQFTPYERLLKCFNRTAKYPPAKVIEIAKKDLSKGRDWAKDAMSQLVVRWYTPAEALKMATADNGQLMALSGFINPYPGKLGVVEEGALADLLVVDGDPLENIKLVEDLGKNFVVIMKDGTIYKDTLPK